MIYLYCFSVSATSTTEAHWSSMLAHGAMTELDYIKQFCCAAKTEELKEDQIRAGASMHFSSPTSQRRSQRVSVELDEAAEKLTAARSKDIEEGFDLDFERQNALRDLQPKMGDTSNVLKKTRDDRNEAKRRKPSKNAKHWMTAKKATEISLQISKIDVKDDSVDLQLGNSFARYEIRVTKNSQQCSCKNCMPCLHILHIFHQMEYHVADYDRAEDITYQPCLNSFEFDDLKRCLRKFVDEPKENKKQKLEKPHYIIERKSLSGQTRGAPRKCFGCGEKIPKSELSITTETHLVIRQPESSVNKVVDKHFCMKKSCVLVPFSSRNSCNRRIHPFQNTLFCKIPIENLKMTKKEIDNLVEDNIDIVDVTMLDTE